MNYRNILFAGCGLFFLFALPIRGCKKIKEDKKPNIVFILADDYGWKDVGYNGKGFYETPNIDQLAKDGMVFTNNYAAGPNCAPSRASLMSGMYTPRHHLYTPGGKSKGQVKYMKLKVPTRSEDETFDIFQSNNDEIDSDIICIPEILTKGGYVSARFGKWHIGEDIQGFDLISSNGKVSGLEEKHYGDINVADQLTDAGIKFIEDHKEQPFFLYLSHWDVHTPIQAKPEVVARFQEKLNKFGGGWNPTYAAMIEAVDKCVGNVRAKLKELGLEKNTLVIFTSDNGGQPHITSNHPLKGGKGSLFEGGIRVPACMAWPGTVKPGSSCNVPIIGVDFLPTFAELAKVPLPVNQSFDGESITPLLKGAKQLNRQSIFWHYPLYLKGNKNNNVLPVCGTNKLYWRGVPSSAIRKGDWKLIYSFEDHSVRLYNLADDISEVNELSLTHPEKTNELLKELKAWQENTNAPVPDVMNPKFEVSDLN
ncbi:MAG: sulfatase [Carboxylicivirga sp.]|jgi:arylsulfatase A-like enzyme|nr:sulfatase [Carboxylicivirga sp.]